MVADPSRLSATLVALGWSAAWERSFVSFLTSESIAGEAVEPGRVLAGARDQLRVGTMHGEEEALVPGRLLYRAESPAELPCTGDWLVLRRLGGIPATAAAGGRVVVPPQPLLVEAVLPRRSAFVRRAAGRRSEPQALAANVDLALLVAALDGDWNPRRLERWLALAREAGVPPVVVLTKADLGGDPAPVVAAAAAIATPAPVHAVDALGGAGVDALQRYLDPGATLVLLGSSGVGKSTLANRLAGRESHIVERVGNRLRIPAVCARRHPAVDPD